MIIQLFKCPSCGRIPETTSNPYCELCLGLLPDAPDLCKKCFQHHGKTLLCADLFSDNCLPNELHALFFLTDPAYDILRKWKKSPGSRSTKRLYERGFNNKNLGCDFDLIVPIPPKSIHQTHPNLYASEYLGKKFAIPIIHAALKNERTEIKMSDLDQANRLSTEGLFSLNDMPRLLTGRKILLIDDFLTTGSTLRNAIQALRTQNPASITALCLGYRPRVIPGLTPAHLNPEQSH